MMFSINTFRRRIIILVLSALFISYLQETVVLAQSPESAVPSDPQKTDESPLIRIQSQLEKLDGEISRLESVVAVKPSGGAQEPVSVSIVSSELDLMKELRNIYLRQITALQRKETLVKSDTDLDKMIDVFHSNGIPEKPPYTIKLFDSMHDQLEAERTKQDTLRLAIDTSRKELADIQAILKLEEKSYRELKDQIKPDNPDDKQKLKIAQLKKSVLKSLAYHKEIQLDIARLELKINQKHIDFIKTKINKIKKHVNFTQKELSEKIVELEKKTGETERQLHQAKIKLSANEARLADARESLKSARGELEITRQQNILDSKESWVQASVDQVEMLEETLNNTAIARELWDRRFAVFTNRQSDDYAKWKQEITTLLENTKRTRQVLEARLLDLKTTITNLRKKLESWDTSYGAKSDAESKLRALEKSEEFISQRLSDIISLIRLAELLNFQVQEELQHITLSDGILWFKKLIYNVWTLELCVIGEQSVTVKRVMQALILVFVGIYFSRKVTSIIRKEAVLHTRLDENSGKALEKLMYYFLLLLIGLLALNILNIPLTLFTFFGGAIAIAIGFGAQNLLNNFISGLIIMFEKPIKINDIIQYENNFGRVVDIGARCTLIRLMTGIEILVPNSSIIEKTVTNLTFSDYNIQQSISIGVSYGSIPKEVEKILLDVVLSDSRILKVPEPIVLFTEFGENSLNFEILFWIQISRLVDSKVVRSDLRFKIDEKFREAGISIAYPQRDIHIDTSKPIEVKVIQ